MINLIDLETNGRDCQKMVHYGMVWYSSEQNGMERAIIQWGGQEKTGYYGKQRKTTGHIVSKRDNAGLGMMVQYGVLRVGMAQYNNQRNRLVKNVTGLEIMMYWCFLISLCTYGIIK